jgi:squalene-associated FAD-dependent desaturase
MTVLGKDSAPVVIVGGGLAGLAAAAALVRGGVVRAGRRVRVLEARRQPGGRAASFEDPAAGGLVDACQHVALGCCTNFLDLCRQGGIEERLRRDRTLVFIDQDGRRAACTPSSRLPAPLHLLPLLTGMPGLSAGERFSLALAMLRLARTGAEGERLVAEAWLRGIGQRDRLIERFWRPVLESALGEEIGLVSVAACQKVIRDGFLAHARAADLLVPLEPLGTLFGERLAGWLETEGVSVESGRSVVELVGDAAAVTGVRVADVASQRAWDGGLSRSTRGAEPIACDGCILAVPWKAAARLAPAEVGRIDERLAGSPITAVHLWFDAPVVDLPHAILLGGLSQWVFRPHGAAEGYCQVVISGSRGLLAMDRVEVVERVAAEVRRAFPAGRRARLMGSRMVTDPTSVISVKPGVEAVRPPARTARAGLLLAGDWTATGWPSTMEGAVRSGRLAADAWLVEHGLAPVGLTPELPLAWLTARLVGG